MASPRSGFVADTSTNIQQLLQFADSWSALKAEWDTFGTNGVAVTQADLDAVFGAGRISVQDYNNALAAMQGIVDAVHVPATAAKLYKVKR